MSVGDVSSEGWNIMGRVRARDTLAELYGRKGISDAFPLRPRVTRVSRGIAPKNEIAYVFDIKVFTIYSRALSPALYSEISDLFFGTRHTKPVYNGTTN